MNPLEPPYGEKFEIFFNVEFDSLKEVSWGTERNAKKHKSLPNTFTDKIKKNHQLWISLFGHLVHVGWVAGPNLGDPGWGDRVPVVAVLPVLCCGGWQHSHVLGAGPVLGLGLVHL